MIVTRLLQYQLWEHILPVRGSLQRCHLLRKYLQDQDHLRRTRLNMRTRGDQEVCLRCTNSPYMRSDQFTRVQRWARMDIGMLHKNYRQESPQRRRTGFIVALIWRSRSTSSRVVRLCQREYGRQVAELDSMLETTYLLVLSHW